MRNLCVPKQFSHALTPTVSSSQRISFSFAVTALAESDSSDCQTIAEIACGNDDFETLCAAVTAADLADTLDDKDEHFTVFAPNDDAFDNLPDGTVEALLGDIPALTNILLFHVVSGHVLEADDLHCQDKIEMANGKKSRTVCDDGDIFQKGAGNSRDETPEIIATDIEACNGVIHVVSEVMLPP